MIKFKLFCILFITSAASYAQQINFEQKAFDYFFSDLFKKEYPKVGAVQFGSCTVKLLTEFDLFKNCFEGEDQIRKELYYNAHGKSLAEKAIDVSAVKNVSFKNRKTRSGLTLHVLHATVATEKVYVMIALVKPLHYTDAYFFELDGAGNVLRWCKTGLIE